MQINPNIINLNEIMIKMLKIIPVSMNDDVMADNYFKYYVCVVSFITNTIIYKVIGDLYIIIPDIYVLVFPTY